MTTAATSRPAYNFRGPVSSKICLYHLLRWLTSPTTITSTTEDWASHHQEALDNVGVAYAGYGYGGGSDGIKIGWRHPKQPAANKQQVVDIQRLKARGRDLIMPAVTLARSTPNRNQLQERIAHMAMMGRHHHPPSHVVQGPGRYNGVIFYSLGDRCLAATLI